MGWAEEYAGIVGGQQHAKITQKRAAWMLDDLIARVQAGHVLMDMARAEGVAERYVEQCVERIQLMTLGAA